MKKLVTLALVVSVGLAALATTGCGDTKTATTEVKVKTN